MSKANSKKLQGIDTTKKDTSLYALESRIQALSALVARTQLFSRLGNSYEGNRNLYQALGYKEDLEYKDYAAQYSRQDIAKAVIDRPVNATWFGKIKLYEPKLDKETKFQTAWEELSKRLNLIPKFIRLDKLSGIGHYGVLLLGLDDVNADNNAGFSAPVSSGNRKLLYVKPFSEGTATISKYEDNPTSDRYGLPVLYNISNISPGNDNGQVKNISVHYTRIIHVADELLESEYSGVPRLEVVFNRLIDLEKIVGGDGEMFWRGARPGYQIKIDPDYDLTAEDQDTLKAKINEYEHNLRRMIGQQGMSFEALTQQIANPMPHVEVQLQMISAVKGIPKRILIGSEQAKLASTVDKSSWLELIKSRREHFAEPIIIRPFVSICNLYGILPKPESNGFAVSWEDLWSPSEKEKAETGEIMSRALAAYGQYPEIAQKVPFEVFYRFFLGLSDDKIEEMEQLLKKIPVQVIDKDTPLKDIEPMEGK